MASRSQGSKRAAGTAARTGGTGRPSRTVAAAKAAKSTKATKAPAAKAVRAKAAGTKATSAKGAKVAATKAAKGSKPAPTKAAKTAKTPGAAKPISAAKSLAAKPVKAIKSVAKSAASKAKATATKAPAKVAAKADPKGAAKAAPAKSTAAKAPAVKATAGKSAPAAKPPAAKATKAGVGDAAPTKAKGAAKAAASATVDAAPKAAAAAAKKATATTTKVAPGLAPKAAPVRLIEPLDATKHHGPALAASTLDRLREQLTEERARHADQAAALLAEADELASEREPGDTQFDEESGEGDNLTVERERDLALSASARQTVEEIDKALARIAAGTYGYCEMCGDRIVVARLEAIPWADLCVRCKSRAVNVGADAFRARGLGVALGLVGIVALDQATKAWATHALADGPIDVIGHTVQLKLTRNSGSAFSRFQGFTPVLALLAVVIAFVLARTLRRATDVWATLALTLVLGGALGNLTDRVVRAPGVLHGEVIDFVKVGWWPVFNVADSAITVGAVILVLRSLVDRPHADAVPHDAPVDGAHGA